LSLILDFLIITSYTTYVMIDDNQTTNTMKTTLTSELVIEKLSELEGWEPYLDNMSGTLQWNHSNSDVVVYATPNWDTDGMTPLAMFIIDDDYLHVTQFETPDLDTYITVMTMVFKSLRT